MRFTSLYLSDAKEGRLRETVYLTFRPRGIFRRAGAADTRCIYLRHSARETIFAESQDKEPRFAQRTAIINYRADVTLSVSSVRRNDNIRVVQPVRTLRRRIYEGRGREGETRAKTYDRARAAARAISIQRFLNYLKNRRACRIRIYDAELHSRFISRRDRPTEKSRVAKRERNERACCARRKYYCWSC